ncbi:MAG TPA: hypothetical protein VK715_03650 [Steroidobacteraceae bacterium]|nr:hypothetical protein [Steroidobacteraceae bacterium]
MAWAAAGFAAGALGAGFCGFTGTFDVMGFGLGGGRVAFLATAALRTAFLGIAFPGFLAALIGFFEGIWVSASKERARDYTDALLPVQGGNGSSFWEYNPLISR